MNISKDILDSIELSNLLNRIELQIQNIEVGDAHTEIGRLMSFPFKTTADNSSLRIEAMKECHGMLYKAFGMICQISLETSNNELLVVVDKSCTRMVDLLLSCQLKIEKAPMCNPFGDLYNKVIISLQQNDNDSLISNIKKLSSILFV